MIVGIFGIVERHHVIRAKQQAALIRADLSAERLDDFLFDFIESNDIFEHFEIVHDLGFSRVRRFEFHIIIRAHTDVRIVFHIVVRTLYHVMAAEQSVRSLPPCDLA